MPCTAARPRIRRVAITIGIATAVCPIVFPSGSAATTRWAGISSASTILATITSSQLPATPAAAIFSRPMANITRDRLVITRPPAMPGANTTNASTSSGTGLAWLARTCAAGTASAAITAVPSQDSSSTARVDPAQARSNSAPSLAGKDRESANYHRQGQHRGDGVEHLRGIVEDDDRAGGSAPVGQRDDYHGSMVDD